MAFFCSWHSCEAVFCAGASSANAIAGSAPSTRTAMRPISLRIVWDTSFVVRLVEGSTEVDPLASPNWRRLTEELQSPKGITGETMFPPRAPFFMLLLDVNGAGDRKSTRL